MLKWLDINGRIMDLGKMCCISKQYPIEDFYSDYEHWGFIIKWNFLNIWVLVEYFVPGSRLVCCIMLCQAAYNLVIFSQKVGMCW
jgi:hypothetical protein